MFGSAVLEVAIGIVFVFLLVSLIASQFGNSVSELLKWRAIELENGIRDLILNGDPAQLQQLYNNPLVQGLGRKETGLQRVIQRIPRFQSRAGERPVSIPARTFILAFFNTFVPNSSGITKIDQLIAAVNGMGNSPLKAKLMALLTTTNGTVDDARKNVEDWFNGSMDRVTELYKRNMWRLAFGIGLVVSIVLNVDAVAVTSNLWRDPTLRSAVAGAAQQYELNNNPTAARQQLDRLNLPIGWSGQVEPAPKFLGFISLTPKDWIPTPGAPPAQPGLPNLGTYLLKFAGWLITGLGAAQGAPFWFDLLKKLTQRDTSPETPA